MVQNCPSLTPYLSGPGPLGDGGGQHSVGGGVGLLQELDDRQGLRQALRLASQRVGVLQQGHLGHRVLRADLRFDQVRALHQLTCIKGGQRGNEI